MLRPHRNCAQTLQRAGYLTGLSDKVHVGPDHLHPWKMWQENNRHGGEAPGRDTAIVADKASAFFEGAKQEAKPFFLTMMGTRVSTCLKQSPRGVSDRNNPFAHSFAYIDPHRHHRQRGGFGNRDGFDERIEGDKYDPKDVELPSWISAVPEPRQELAKLYRSINRLEQGVGLMMEALKRNGVEDSTLVILLSDNGPAFVNSKMTLYDADVCLPLLIRVPGQKAEIASPKLMSYIDILPTMLDWADQNVKINVTKRLGRSGSAAAFESLVLR